jgi:hypothetical protein
VRFPRMTTRRLLFAVATAAVVLGVHRVLERRAYFLTRAEVDASRADDLAEGRMCLRDEFCVDGYPEKLLEYWRASARKYRQAANQPWLPVEPDLDVPEP